MLHRLGPAQNRQELEKGHGNTVGWHPLSFQLLTVSVYAELAHKTPATEALAKQPKMLSRTAPASAPEKRKALGRANENTPVPGKSSGRPAMDVATEVKQLRQLCTLLRAELAAQRKKVTDGCI